MMSAAVVLLVGGAMLATSILSGIFGMAGGMILMGLLLWLLPLADAMTLHGVTQIASNGWRGLLWVKFVRWRAAAAFLAGALLAFLVWTVWRYVPTKPVALLLLGLSPFVVRWLPDRLRPDPERPLHGLAVGAGSMTLMLFSGISGPLIDTFFLGGKFDRREIVATKAICQVASHLGKTAYFGGLIADAVRPELFGLAVVMPIIGTSLARPILEAMSDTHYRAWANRIITVIASFYLCTSAYLFLH